MNKEKILRNRKGYNETHKEERRKYAKQYNKEYRKTHKEQLKANTKKYLRTHKKQIKKRMRIYNKKFMQNPKHKLNGNISCLINQSLKGNKQGRHWESCVDFTQEDLMTHLKTTIPKGFTW